jgi:flagellar biosynthesis protein FliR
MEVIQNLLGFQLWGILVVFVRVGAAFIVLPVVGETFVSPQWRLGLALIVSVVLAPTLGAQIPPSPANVFALLVLLGKESLIGFFIGTVGRVLMSTLETAGMLIALQSGLSNAMMFNPAMSSQGSLPGALMGWLGLVILFATDLHHLLLGSVADSYALFHIGGPLPVEDMAWTVSRLVSETFSIGVRMAAPFLAAGILFSLALGLLNKLAPQIQVFFVMMPAQVGIGLILFSFTLSLIMLFWLRFFEQTLLDVLRMS